MSSRNLLVCGVGLFCSAITAAQTCTPNVEGMVAGGVRFSVDGDLVYLNRGAAGVAVLQRTAGGQFELVGECLDDIPTDFTVTRSISGDGGLVAISGSAPPSVLLLDISVPAAPTVVGEIRFGVNDPSIQSVGVRGSTLFVITPTWFKAFDVSDPAVPVELGTQHFPGAARAEFAVGDGFLLASGGGAWPGQVELWDVSDPTSPALASQVQGRYFALDGTTLLAGGPVGAQAGFDMYDVTDPSAPAHLGGLSFNLNPELFSFTDLALADGMVVVRIDREFFDDPLARVFDVSNPLVPVQVYSGNLKSPAYPALPLFDGADIGGEFVFLSGGRLWAYDDLSAGFMMSHRYGSEIVEPVLKRGDQLVVRAGERLMIGPDAPIDSFVVTDTVTLSDFPAWMSHRTYWYGESASGLLYVIRADLPYTGSMVSAIDLNAAGGPAEVGSLSWDGVPSGAVTAGEYLYLAQQDVGLIRVAIESDGEVSEIGQGPLVVSGVRGLVGGDGALYAHTRSGETLSVYDTSDPASPVYVGRLDDTLSMAPYFVVGDHMYSGMIGGAYRVFDLTDPLQPKIETGTSAPLPDGARLVGERDGVLYFIRDGRLSRVDVNDPSDQHLMRADALVQDWLPAAAEGLSSRMLGSSIYFYELGYYLPTRVIEFDVEGCAEGCRADLAAPFGVLNFFDAAVFLDAYNSQSWPADFAEPFGTFNFFDVAEFLAAYSAGCP